MILILRRTKGHFIDRGADVVVVEPTSHDLAWLVGLLIALEKVPKRTM
jgi:hypothetical protein